MPNAPSRPVLLLFAIAAVTTLCTAPWLLPLHPSDDGDSSSLSSPIGDAAAPAVASGHLEGSGVRGQKGSASGDTADGSSSGEGDGGDDVLAHTPTAPASPDRGVDPQAPPAVLTSPHNAPFLGHGNGRAVVPLLLTHVRYHGTSLLATTLHGWVKHFLEPQGNVDLVICYDVDHVDLTELIAMLRLRAVQLGQLRATLRGDADWQRHLRNEIVLSDADAALLGTSWFTTPFSDTFLLRVHPVRLPFPEYIRREPSLLNISSWMRCGCPPYCPAPRATVQYVQGTRWYTLDMFGEPVITQYSFWIKLDVDIWIFRRVPFNFVDEMRRAGSVFAHTGYEYNGNRCSVGLQAAIESYCADRGIVPVAAGLPWWRQDDNVYHSNFVVSAMGFGVSAAHLALTRNLSEVRDGFFRYRWTDQSLFHKVFGVFLGPQEADFALDWSWLRWRKGVFHERAVFWHSKRLKTRRDLQRWTRL